MDAALSGLSRWESSPEEIGHFNFTVNATSGQFFTAIMQIFILKQIVWSAIKERKNRKWCGKNWENDILVGFEIAGQQ